jgi:Domain of unknown function (DUF4329)
LDTGWRSIRVFVLLRSNPMADPVSNSPTQSARTPPPPAANDRSTGTPQSQAQQLIARNSQLGVPNADRLAQDLAKAYRENPAAAAELHAQVAGALSSADQAALDRSIAPILTGVAAMRTAQATSPTPVSQASVPSADAAAYRAMEQANPQSIRSNLEYGGYVFKDQNTGRYSASNPVSGTPTGFDPRGLPVPAGKEVVGLYHTHGDYSLDVNGQTVRTSNAALDGYNSDHFSQQDKSYFRSAARGQPEYTGYVGTPSGEFRSFDPTSAADKVMRTPASEVRGAARQGALVGAGIELAVSGAQALRDGRIDAGEAGDMVQASARGAVVGGTYAVTEQGLVRALDRTAGSTLQRASTAAAARFGAADAVALGAGGRVLATRLGGAGAAGAVISAGISIYDNRDGLARGDSKAIGRVAGDVVVGASAALGGAAAGAAIGSVVPVVGTAVGAVVGLGVGIATDYVMRAGGVDKAVANVVSGGVDAVKGAASRVASWLGW